MIRQFEQGEADEELLSLDPEFDETILPASLQKRIKRSMEQESTNAIIRANKIANHHKVAMVSLLCQGQVEDAVTIMLSRNPRRHAAANLFALAQANAEYLYHTVADDLDDIWRW